MKNSLLLLAIVATLVGLTSCGSSKNKGDTEIMAPLEPARTAKKDYEVLDFSESSTPTWTKAPSQVDLPEERINFRYFLSESAHVDQRLCVKSAEVRATGRIASEIAQFMKNSYAEATQGGGNEQVSEYMQEQLAQEAQTFLVGVQVAKTYWEKRKYLEKLGAIEDKVKFYCYAVVKMEKKNLETAIKKSTEKLLSNVKNPEVKQKTNKILKEVGKKFSNLDQPVPLESDNEKVE
jgi:YesN/AraC family two-component response regulator